MFRTLQRLGATFALSIAGTALALAGTTSPAFQPNLGQFDPQVAFYGEQQDAHLFVTREGELVHRFPAPDGGAWVLVERFDQSGPLQPTSAEPGEGSIGWVASHETRSAPVAQRIDLGTPWPGIRADLHVAATGYEKQFHLVPGTDATAIRMALEGIEGMQRAEDGRLLLRTGIGTVEMSAPVAWQDIDGQRMPVQVAYRIADEKTYGFSLGSHDPAHGVTIDPIVRSTFSGGAAEEGLNYLTMASDSVYILGYSKSINFPGTTGGYQPNIIRSTTSGGNIFVARYSLDLRTLMQATYFGVFGPIPESGTSSTLTPRQIAVSDAGVYISGTAPGTAPVGGMHLPGTAGGLQEAPAGGGGDAFVARFSHDLTTLHQATYYGGPGTDDAWPIALASDGVYISGSSNSTTLAGLENGAYGDPPLPANTGASYIAKLSLDLTSAQASSWISTGGWAMSPRTMTVDDEGNVYVGGDGSNGLLNTTGAFQPARASTGTFTDGFIVRLSPDLSELHRSTWLGGGGHERIDDIRFGEGAIYVAGNSNAPDFPVAPDAASSAYQGNSGAGSGFVAALSPDLSTRVGATFYNGTGNSGSFNGSSSPIAVIPHEGEIYIGGTTVAGTLPASEQGAQPTSPGGVCGFAARLNTGLSQFLMSTFVACDGRVLQFYGMGIGDDTLYLAGRTQQGLTLPGGEDGAQPTKSGGYDAFIIASTLDLAGPRPTADLAVTKTGSEEPIAKRWVLYEITVKNLGPDPAPGARIQDALPPEFTAAGWTCTGSSGASCAQANGSGSIDMLSTLPVDGMLTFALCGYSNGAELIVNTVQASVADNMLDPVSTNNHASAITQDDGLFSDGFEDLDLPPWCPATP